ncbi:putative Toxin RTX-I translocation ATP-binding protein [Candidatus Terasakiella magnetica]|uniref:Putative Toxin RTX-I translocation ATP-binding protein n=1 Tax=Candidatus Terasakiella magnetica TaxID=1867952 RepID=A0A1C3REN4_9PROT|nr:peptidase domain-containing ABC transporter [Candidatus Terasakiella magnetica]SCA55702.1 putative Toxin RTX-I translocation ATP-binding protein [Candidatus Terasakiella magnetica]
MHTALKSMVLAARQRGIELSVDTLVHTFNIGEEEADNDVLIRIAQENGMKAKLATFGLDKLSSLSDAIPLVVRLKDKRCVVVSGFELDEDKKTIKALTVIDPAAANPQAETVEREAFLKHWAGQAILIKRKYDFFDEDRPFDFSWLMSGYFRHKSLMGQLLVIALILHAFAVLPAVFIMIVLDKVVNFEATSTLYVITSGIIIAYLFNGFLGYLRQYIVLFASGKVDVRLNAKLFSKLLDLPLSYFQKRSIPEVSKTLQQTISLRQALTGRFFGAVLDATSLMVFIPILYMYSPLLCGVVILFSFAISANVIIASKLQKRRLQRASAADARKQNILMDSISGIETVKTLALEPVQKKNWEDAISDHTVAHLKLGSANAISQQISSTLQQLMTVAVIFVGVQLVFAGDLSAGVLIGVNMLAGKVTGPLVQLVTLVTDIEKVTRAVDSIGSVMNTRGEMRRRGEVPEILGDVTFHNVNFGYDDGARSLNNLSFNIQPRQKVAIVGPTGSGKTTIGRMIQGIVRPQDGTVTIDGHDLRLMDLAHLRYNVACVTQTPHFFKGTIRENIMQPFPGAGSARVIWAAEMVGLDADVDGLSDGYETQIEEGGSNLSVGMRHKIALARALIRNPRILILDEAFAHFDLDTENAVRQRMPDIASGRTLLVIAHRISHARECDHILVMKDGHLVENGKHEDLIAKKGVYAEMWKRELNLIGLPQTQIEKPEPENAKVETAAKVDQTAKTTQSTPPRKRGWGARRKTPQPTPKKEA